MIWLATAAVAGAGSAAADRVLTGRDIKDGTIETRDLSKKARQSLRGEKGYAGAKGEAGAKGDTGAQGPAGAQGPQGPSGSSGGTAGGDLTGSYPNPSIAAGAVTAAKLGTMPAVRVRHSADQAVADLATLMLSFDTESYDTQSLHETAASSRLTAPIAGIYDITANVAWKPANGTYRSAEIVLNGSTSLAMNRVSPVPTGPAQITAQSVNAQARLSAGDYVEVRVTHSSSGATAEVATAAEYSPVFQMHWVSP